MTTRLAVHMARVSDELQTAMAAVRYAGASVDVLVQAIAEYRRVRSLTQ